MHNHVEDYCARLARALSLDAMNRVPLLGEALRETWRSGRSVYLCGNGGSAANAVHLANDLLSAPGIRGAGLQVEALCANPAVLTSLSNDLGYENVYAEQLLVKARAGDLLLVLSGSGNSANVVKAIEVANLKRMKTFAILGFTGGVCKSVAQHPIHFEIDDMQIAEDLQLIVGHMCMQWLCANPVNPCTTS